MTISVLLFWGLLVAGGVLIVRALTRSSGPAAAAARPSPEQLLAERFARGEVDEEEYRRRLAALAAAGQAAHAPPGTSPRGG